MLFFPGRRKALQKKSQLEARRSNGVLSGAELGPELCIPATERAASPPAI